MSVDEVVDKLIARAEREDPARVVRLLEPFVTERRQARLRAVIDARLASVAVILDAPYDPHNGAAVVRSCEAFGVQALHVVEREGTPFLVASSVARGAEKWLDVSRYADPSAAVAAARAAGLELVGAHPQGTLEPSELARIPRVAIVMGNERQGIREVLARECTRAVRVPMRGFVESLNMSVTTAILLAAATSGRAGDLDEKDRLRLYARGLYMSVGHARDILAAG